MDRRRALLACALLVALAAAFVSGRATAPTKVRELTRTVEAERKSTTVAHAESTAGNVRVVEGPERITIKRVLVPVPGQPPACEETRVEERGAKTTEARTETASATKTVEVVYRDREVLKDRLVETARPGWSLGAHVGLGLDGHREAGADVARRLFGPFAVTLGVSTTRTVMAGIRVTW